jgi:hypothetical protein
MDDGSALVEYPWGRNSRICASSSKFDLTIFWSGSTAPIFEWLCDDFSLVCNREKFTISVLKFNGWDLHKSTTLLNFILWFAQVSSTRMAKQRGCEDGDVVHRILNTLKLDPPLPKKVVEDIQDALHLLRTRSSIGSLGAKDSERRRACALVEYFAREQCDIQIPMDALGKQSYTKKKADFVKFHMLIGNLRDQWTTNRPKNGNVDTTGTHSAAGATSKSNSSKVDSYSFQQSSINLLAVQLGAFVAHSNVVAKQAQDLFHQMVTAIQTKKYGERIHALQDIQRNQRAYEAACFFLVATDRRCRGSKFQKTPPTKLDEDHQPLDLATFLSATKSFPQREFEMILRYVRKLQQEIKENFAPSKDPQAETTTSSRKRSRISTTATSTTTTATPSQRRNSKENSNVVAQTSTSITMDDEQHAGDTTSFLLQGIGEDLMEGLCGEKRYFQRTSRDFSHVFLEWKQEVLKTVKTKAKETTKLNDDDDNNVTLSRDDEGCDDEEKQLDVAVNAILHQYRLGVVHPNSVLLDYT